MSAAAVVVSSPRVSLAASTHTDPLPGARILVVDDHQVNVDLLRDRLESWGYTVDGATSGVDALAAVERQPPDLILLDVMMPGMDGHEVARRIKARSGVPFIPVIMQTALDSRDGKVAGLEAGADDYLSKPIHFPELRARLRALLRIKALQATLLTREQALLVANAQLRHQSQTDALTGLANRGHLCTRLAAMYQDGVRHHTPVAALMVDIDHFKSVNDSYGHHAGDAVLQQFAAILAAESREVDQPGRYGGEEFMVVLPGMTLDGAQGLAERLRARVDNTTFTFPGGTVARTASFGVAAWPHPAITTADALVRAADDALYVAKETGRNRVVRHDSPEFVEHRARPDRPSRTGTRQRR
jgi:two-component system cell cycle response regulator